MSAQGNNHAMGAQGENHAMRARIAVPHIRSWVKLAAVLILLAGLLLGGILSAPASTPAQALNALPQVNAPSAPVPTGVSGTLASFTALIPLQTYLIHLPYLTR